MSEVTDELVDHWFRTRYASMAPATWNRELATLRSAVAWWQLHGWLADHADLTIGLARRREHPDHTRALTRSQLEALWRRSDLPLRGNDTLIWIWIGSGFHAPSRWRLRGSVNGSGRRLLRDITRRR
jgi:hypothetical protein